MRPCLEEEKEEKEAERKEEYHHFLWKSSMLEDPNSTHSIKLSAGLHLLLWMTLCPGASLVSHVQPLEPPLLPLLTQPISESQRGLSHSCSHLFPPAHSPLPILLRLKTFSVA